MIALLQVEGGVCVLVDPFYVFLPLSLFLFFFFFFQAEDGIRDHCVTGVQTCALPISIRTLPRSTRGSCCAAGAEASRPRARRTGACHPLLRLPALFLGGLARRGFGLLRALRSEERRVGKECGSRWWRGQLRKQGDGSR